MNEMVRVDAGSPPEQRRLVFLVYIFYNKVIVGIIAHHNVNVVILQFVCITHQL